jgi:ABC-type glycerol-3-phosphate transport system substrate-binding protein
MLAIVLVVSFSILPACKTQVSEETTAAVTTAAETTAAETTAAETTAPETTAAAKEILIRMSDFQGASPNYTKAYEEIFALYQQTYPNVKFDRKAYGWEEYTQAIKPMLASGDIPDLVGLYQGPDTIAVVDAGLILPLKEKIEGDAEWLGRLGKGMVEFPDLLIENEIYQVAFDAISCALLYHKDIFSKVGISQKPVFIDEFKAANEKLRANNYYCAYQVWDMTALKETINVLVAMQTGSVDMINDAIDGKISWQNDVFLNALKVIEYGEKEMTAPDAGSVDYNIEMQRFVEKTAWGKWYAGEWEIGVYTEMAKDDVSNGEYGLANIPAPTADSNPNVYIGGPGQTYSVSAKSENVETALDFLKFLSSPEVAQIMLKNDIHPAAKIDNPEKYTSNSLLLEFLKLADEPNYMLVPFSMKSAEAEENIKENLGLMYLGQMTPEEFLADLDAAFYNK